MMCFFARIARDDREKPSPRDRHRASLAFSFGPRRARTRSRRGAIVSAIVSAARNATRKPTLTFFRSNPRRSRAQVSFRRRRSGDGADALDAAALPAGLFDAYVAAVRAGGVQAWAASGDVAEDDKAKFAEYLAEYAAEHPEDAKPSSPRLEGDEAAGEAGEDAEDEMDVDEPIAEGNKNSGDQQDAPSPDDDAGAADDVAEDAEAAADEKPRRGPGRPPGGRGRGRGRHSARGRDGGSGAARVAAPRGRPKRSRVKARSLGDFAVGCRVAVFWRKEQEWFFGSVADQQGDGGLVMSKVEYDDGDVEVLDLFAASAKVRLIAHAGGAPASDADEPLDAGSAEEREEEDPEDPEAPLETERSRLRDRRSFPRTGANDGRPEKRRGPGRPRGAGGRGGGPSSRRAAGKEDSPPARAPGGQPGPSALGEEARERRRNPARVAAMHAMDTDGVNYDYGELPPEEEFPVTDEKVLAVLAMMQSNETARALAELPEDPEPSAEVFRLGYKMGARRALRCAAAAIAAAAARAPALRPADVSAEAGNARRGAVAEPLGAAPAPAASPARAQRQRKETAKAAELKKAQQEKQATATASVPQEPPQEPPPRKGSDDAAGVGDEGAAAAGSAPEGAAAALDPAAAEAEAAAAAAALRLAAEEADAQSRKASHARGETIRANASEDGGSWEDPVAAASLDPALASVLSALERVLAEEVYAPKSWADADLEAEEEDVAAALARTHPEAARLYAAGAIDPHVVAGLLGVDADAEQARARRGLGRGLEARALSSALPVKLEIGASASKTPGKTPKALKTPGSSKPPGRPASTPSAVLMSPEEVIAAAFAEAAEKREAAEAAVAAIGDPKKVAMVRDDALKTKPTTTAGRLIKAANNADQRAEKIQAGGGGDGRALRVQGVRKSETKNAKARGGTPGGLSSQNAKPGLKPSEAPLMERSGAGAEAFEFRPPLAKTPRAAAAAAFAAVAEEAKSPPEEEAPEDGPEKADKAEKAGGGGGDAAARTKKGSSARKPSVGAAGWGDGDRELAGDKRVTNWLEFRGFGEYAAAFAARGITLGALKTLTMSDLEDVPVEGAAAREAIFAKAAEYAKEAAERAAKRAEKAASDPPKKKNKTEPPAAE
jgi:hypothetical protein